MELPAGRARAITGDDRPHARGALYQEVDTDSEAFRPPIHQSSIVLSVRRNGQS